MSGWKRLYECMCLHELTCSPWYDFLWSPVTSAVYILILLLTRGLGKAGKRQKNMTLSSTSHTPYTHVHTSLHDRADIQQEQVSQPSSLSDWTSTVCPCILRWLCLPPDGVRQTAVISHLRRHWMHDSRGTSHRSVFCFIPSTLVPGTLWFTTIKHGLHQLCDKRSACVHVLPTLDSITEINSGGSGHPMITSPLHLISE